MRTTNTMSVSLPPKMVEQVERVRHTEQRTRSELVREALRLYFRRVEAVEPTGVELDAIRRGRAEIARGKYVTLKQLRDGLAGSRRKKRRKSRRKGAS